MILFTFIASFFSKINNISDYIQDQKKEAIKSDEKYRTEEIDIPYNTQRDNKINPSGACNVTCVHMAISSLGYNTYSDDDLYTMANSKDTIRELGKLYGKQAWVKNLIRKKKANTIWLALRYVANSVFKETGRKHKCVFDGKLSLKEVEDYIKDEIPVILGTKLTRSGHLIIVKGLIYENKSGKLYALKCNDPWGDATTKYRERNGQDVIYPIDFLWHKIKTDRALVFTKTNRKRK